MDSNLEINAKASMVKKKKKTKKMLKGREIASIWWVVVCEFKWLIGLCCTPLFDHEAIIEHLKLNLLWIGSHENCYWLCKAHEWKTWRWTFCCKLVSKEAINRWWCSIGAQAMCVIIIHCCCDEGIFEPTCGYAIILHFFCVAWAQKKVKAHTWRLSLILD